MTTYEKTVRLARLIGLDYHASESKRKVWRQTRPCHEWTLWRPYECLANLEPIMRWLEREHPAWLRSQPYEYQAAFCDSVLAAFAPDPEPDESYEPAIVRAPEPEPTALAEYHDAMRNDLRAEAECKRLTAIVADRNEAIAVLQDVIEEQAANATERGE